MSARTHNILKRGFLSLIVTQFFGAVNDNIIKNVMIFMVVDGLWRDAFGNLGGQGVISLAFTIPFILLSGYAGQFADRRSKRTVSVLVKIAEIPISVIAALGFFTGNLWLTMTALVMLTCQSTFFGPAKYGMIPELVNSDELSRANGAINMLTNIAVIFGTVLAGIIADRYAPQNAGADPMRWLPGAAMIVLAVLGLISVLFLPKLEAGDPGLQRDLNPFGVYWRALREMAEGPLIIVALAWGYFYLLGGLALLILPEYTVILGVSRQQAGYIMGVMGISIAIGCVAAGLLSGRAIRPQLIPFGAGGIIVFFVLLGVIPPTLTNVYLFVFGAGIAAGFYIIPLQSLLQHLSPRDERGRFLGLANAISFSFLAVAALLFAVLQPLFAKTQQMFLVSAALMIIGAMGFWIAMRIRGYGFGIVGGEVDDLAEVVVNCPACGYPVNELGCPECGWDRSTS